MGKKLSKKVVDQLVQRLNEVARYRALKPPYECPICYKPESIYVTKMKIPGRLNTWEVKCKHGCFHEEIQLAPIYQKVDAFCKVLDKLVKEASEQEIVIAA